MEVSALLRSAGRTERFSRTGRVRDVAAVKAVRTERARAERTALKAAWDRLDTGGGIRLSRFAQLEHEVLERLLDLLGRALATAPDQHGVHRATTGDGRVEILLTPPEGHREQTVIRTCGVFTSPDYDVEIRAPGGRASGRRGLPKEWLPPEVDRGCLMSGPRDDLHPASFLAHHPAGCD